MRTKNIVVAALAGAPLVASQSLCDKHTTNLLGSNTAANEYTLLQLLVNTVVIGNYTQPNVGIAVPGILAPATYMGEQVNLLPYFNGCLKSSNRGAPTAINFLDGGAAQSIIDGTLLQNPGTQQYKLLTHLYEFFGTLLGCSQQGQPGFPAYDGQASMFEVHKYMALSPAEVGYFISQVGLAASSFGVPASDVSTVASLLGSVFNVACAPAVALVNNDTEFQSICVAKDCPLAPGAVCGSYENGGFFPEPMASGNAGCPMQQMMQQQQGWNDTAMGGAAGGPKVGGGGRKGGACPAKRRHK